MTRSRSRWSMRAGPRPVVTVATWPSGTATLRPSGPCTNSGSAARSLTLVARLGRQPHVDVARLAGRVDPVAGVEAGERRRAAPAPTWPTRHAEAAGQAAVESTSSSGFWPRVDRPTSTAPGTCSHLRLQQLRPAGSARRARARAAAAGSASGSRSCRCRCWRVDAAEADQLRAQRAPRRSAAGARARPSASAARRRSPRRPTRCGRRSSCRCRAPRACCAPGAPPPRPSASCSRGSSPAASRC